LSKTNGSRPAGYVDFRRRVQEFDFSPALFVEVALSEANEEDCFGNTSPPAAAACGRKV